MRLVPLVLVLVAVTAAPWAVARAQPAILVYPPNGALDIPGNTRIFASDTAAIRLEGPLDDSITALLDPQYSSLDGAAFAPTQVLTPGTYRVLALPSEDASNYAGPDVVIELGTFMVGDEFDEEPMSMAWGGGVWAIGDDDNDIRIGGSRLGGHPWEPFVLEIDLGDADTPLDGEPDVASSWVAASSVVVHLGRSVPQIDPHSATLQVRLVDAAGNVGAWELSIAFELVETLDPPPRSCAAAPGSATPGAGWALGALILVAALRRRQPRDR